MTYHSDAEILSIRDRFADRTLPKPEWTHAAHFAAALGLLAKYGAKAYEKMPRLIRAYNEATGVPNSDSDGYHETITIASLRAAEDFLKKAGPNTPLFETVNTIITSPYGRPDWLLEHWSKEVIFSPKARRQWVAPNIKPLPFGDV
jgi:hypothetical protein